MHTDFVNESVLAHWMFTELICPLDLCFPVVVPEKKETIYCSIQLMHTYTHTHVLYREIDIYMKQLYIINNRLIIT